jgi:hypothetical protein
MNTAQYISFNGAPPIDDRWTSVSVHSCENENYDVNSEDKILVGLLISMKHSSTSTSNNIKLRYSGAAQNGNSRGSTFTKL